MNIRRKRTRFLACPAAFLLIPFSLMAQNSLTPGAVSTPYPTVSNLAVEWLIIGDDNYNAVCAVTFRKQGDAAWRQGMPLRRVAAGQSQGTTPIYKWDNKFSGSVFDLAPGTPYEIRLSLSDPDGGAKDTTVIATTRPVPRITASCTIHDVPDGSNGALTITTNGTQASPLVYRSVSGKAVYTSVDISNRQWVFLEGLTVNGSYIVMDGAKNCVVRRCSVTVTRTDNKRGAIDGQTGITNCYITDNYVNGPVKWIGSEMGASGASMVEGIQITGCGNVVRNNYVKGFHDCLSHMEDDEVAAAGQICNDWCFNDVLSGLDDGIEADFAFNNCRIISNRFTDCFNAMSSQPSLGGPTYFIRNVVFNAGMGAFKLNRYSVGDVILHNTIIKGGDGLCTFDGDPFDWSMWRNNLALGGTNGGWDGSQVTGGYGPGSGYACNIAACGPHCSYDYDAVGSYKTTYQARICGQNFSAVESHGKKIDSTAFAHFLFPTPLAPEPTYYYPPQDLRPAPACTAVVDKAVVIPNINDTYLGAGPDIGAYEAGQALPVYGPRPAGADEQTPYDAIVAEKYSASPARATTGMTMRFDRGPSSGGTSLTVRLPSTGDDARLFIFDARGKTVKTLRAEKPVSGPEVTWRVDMGVSGVYVVECRSGGGSCARRVVLP
jgi:hypothetical protein